MPDFTSGSTLPSREELEFAPDSASPTSGVDTAAGSGLSLALAVLTEKVKAGTLDSQELIRRIVEQAAISTGASGVALALRKESDGAVVCCASSGEMAPPLGTVLSQDTGFTAECLRSGSLLVCNDASNDPRVDSAVCRRLGVRSIMAAPVENSGLTAGVLEALSDRPFSFSRKHIEALVTLACFAKSVLTSTVSPSAPRTTLAASKPVEKTLPEPRQLRQVFASEAAPPSAKQHRFKIPLRDRRAAVVYIALGTLAVALVATAIFFFVGRQKSDQQASATTAPSGNQLSPAQRPSAPRPSAAIRMTDRSSAYKPSLEKASAVEKIPTREAQEVTTLPVPASRKGQSQAEPPSSDEEAATPPQILPSTTPATIELAGVLSAPPSLPTRDVRLSEGAVPPKLKRRVEPIYPMQAKQLRIEGPVVLRAEINQDGTVGKVGVLNGSPLLAKAAIEAVRKWQYTPSELNHRPVASTADVTVVFKLQ
jgi:TonB family protein